MKWQKMLCFIALFLGLVGIYRGKLAIYNKNDCQRPSTLFPYSANLFSKEDQSALNKGIPFSSEEQLSALLEDFLS